jgi:hypothetical protein
MRRPIAAEGKRAAPKSDPCEIIIASRKFYFFPHYAPEVSATRSVAWLLARYEVGFIVANDLLVNYGTGLDGLYLDQGRHRYQNHECHEKSRNKKSSTHGLHSGHAFLHYQHLQHQIRPVPPPATL